MEHIERKKKVIIAYQVNSSKEKNRLKEFLLLPSTAEFFTTSGLKKASPTANTSFGPINIKRALKERSAVSVDLPDFLGVNFSLSSLNAKELKYLKTYLSAAS